MNTRDRIYKEVKNKTPKLNFKDGKHNICFHSNGVPRLEAHFLNGLRHNEKGAALLWFYKNGDIEKQGHYITGRRHNEKDAAITWFDKNGQIEKQWHYIDGKLHNEKGPAVVLYNRSENIIYNHYWLNDQELTEENWKREIMIINMAGVK